MPLIGGCSPSANNAREQRKVQAKIARSLRIGRLADSFTQARATVRGTSRPVSQPKASKIISPDGAFMKCSLAIVCFLAVACAAVSQQSPAPAVGVGRLFFPRNFIWGYSQFDVAPPHNEPDPNLCAANAGQYGGKDAPCNAFARYLLSGYVEVRPFARTQLRRLFFFGAPT